MCDNRLEINTYQNCPKQSSVHMQTGLSTSMIAVAPMNYPYIACPENMEHIHQCTTGVMYGPQ